MLHDDSADECFRCFLPMEWKWLECDGFDGFDGFDGWGSVT
jgi:hypothetical protein